MEEGIKLLPCPFCGGQNIKICINIAGRYFCVCNYCGSAGRDSSDSRESVDFWNKRSELEIKYSVYTPADYLQTENDLLKGEIEQLENYAADLCIAMRKARKVLRPTTIEGLDIKMIRIDQVDEARKILKEALKTK